MIENNGMVNVEESVNSSGIIDKDGLPPMCARVKTRPSRSYITTDNISSIIYSRVYSSVYVFSREKFLRNVGSVC